MSYYYLVSLLFALFSVGVRAFYIIPKQTLEVLRPRSWLTRLRWIILWLFVVSTMATIPALAALTYRALGIPIPTPLLYISSVANNFAGVLTTVLLILIYNYKQKGDE